MENKIFKTLRFINTLLIVVVVCFIFTLLAFVMLPKQETATTATGGAPIAAAPAGPDLSNPEIAKGKEVFTNNCSACHAVSDEVVVGPGLKGIDSRRDLAWITKWVQNPQKVIASGDKYANDIFKKFNGTQMTAFPNLGEEDIKGVLAFIKASN
ncbi:c-type cytochrome [Flectobacillus major]|jgi:cytochrome c2|uniref:c-type cytochrome n=1 Tax=Flectobacillus major TaxID=103 RepID=UPI00040A2775|nr:cytochrome c [Flectobacillus major]